MIKQISEKFYFRLAIKFKAWSNDSASCLFVLEKDQVQIKLRLIRMLLEMF